MREVKERGINTITVKVWNVFMFPYEGISKSFRTESKRNKQQQKLIEKQKSLD
jgi:hypothetical protein